MNKEEIEILVKKVNEKCPYDQGIYSEPNYVPIHIKEPVVYMRYSTGGVSGGSCWDSSNPRSYTEDVVPNFDVLDILLKEIYPTISYLDYKKIASLIHTNEESEYEYYGNCTDYKVEYIKLSELLDLIDTLKA